MRFLIFAIFIFCLACSEKINLEKEVYEFEQKRETDLAKLKIFLDSQDEKVRQKTYLAIGRVQDSTFIKPLINSFKNEKNDSLKALAAWAFGQIKTQESLDFVISKLQTEQSENVTARLIEAVGKIANFDSSQTFQQVLKILAEKIKLDSELIKGEVGKAVGILYRGRKATPNTLKELLENELPKISSENQWKLLYPFLFFSKVTFEEILPFVKDENPITRTYAIKILANSLNDSTLKIIDSLRTDLDWRVRVSAVSSLRNYRNSPLTGQLLLKFLEDENKLVRSTAIQVCGDLNFSASVQRLKEIIKQENYFLRNESALALAKIWKQSKDNFFKVFKESSDWRERVTYLKVLEILKNYSSAVEMINFYKDVDSRVVAEAVSRTKPFLETLVKEKRLLPKQVKVLEEAFELAIFDVLSSAKDWQVIYVCTDEILKMQNLKNSQPLLNALEILQNPKSQNELESLILVVNALGKFQESKAKSKVENLLAIKDKELSSSCAEALERITGNPNFKGQIQEGGLFRKTYSFEEITSIESQKITFRTSVGNFVIETNPEIAPQTVLNFTQLVTEDFYSEVKFHRVIPNFVSQIGDPNGNGWGGSNYQINCEYNSLTYESGSIGMALSGKDSGGSQFFVTHLPQPHLNGGFTIFGKLIWDKEIISKVSSETKIRKVIIEK